MADALIWGASGGLGSALTSVLNNNGWRVFAAARRIEKIVAPTYRKYSFNAADHRSIKEIAIDLAHETKGFDFWAYMAGSLEAELMQKMTPQAWQNVSQSNLEGAFLTASQTLHLINKGGQVAFVGAYIDHLILPKMGAYAAAKAGLETMVDVWQKEHRNLNFTLVKPGAVATPFWDSAPFKMPPTAKKPLAVAEALFKWAEEKKRGTLAL